MGRRRQHDCESQTRRVNLHPQPQRSTIVHISETLLRHESAPRSVAEIAEKWLLTSLRYQYARAA